MQTPHRSRLTGHRRRLGSAVLVVAAVTALNTAATSAHAAPTSATSGHAHGSPSIRVEPWGSTAEGQVKRYTLTNGHGMRVRILTYGGISATLGRAYLKGERRGDW